MRVLMIQLLLVMVSTVLMRAQSAFEFRIGRFEAKGIALDEALAKLAKKSGVNISFNSEIIPDGRLLDVVLEDKTVVEVLGELVKEAGIRYAIVENQIVLYRSGVRVKKYLLSGMLRDALSGESLLAANVYCKKLGKGASTNALGHYAFYLPEGKHQIVFSYLGYTSKRIDVELYGNRQVDVELSPSITIEEVTIFDSDSIDNGLIQQGAVDIDTEDLEADPGLMGETDIVRILQRQSGVQTGPDGVGGLSIRGGTDDQNLLVVDGTPVYYPNHLFGVYSMINGNALQRTHFSKNQIVVPAGKRLSSVVDVHTRVGSLKKLRGEFSINPSVVKALFEGPLIKKSTSFLFSGRRALQTPIRIIPETGILRQGAESAIRFDDFQLKLYHRMNEYNQVLLQVFSGNDDYRYTLGPEADNPLITKDDRKYQWGNRFVSLHWTSLLNPKLIMKALVSGSSFRYDAQNLSRYDTRSIDGDVLNRYVRLRSSIIDYKLSTDFDYYLNTTHFFRFGFSYVRHVMSPEFLLRQSTEDTEGFSGETTISELENLLPQTEKTILGHWSGYFEDHLSLGRQFRLNVGLYGDLLTRENYSLLQLLPKLAIQYRISQSVKLSLFAQSSSQFFHKFDLDLISYPNSLWIPLSSSIAPKRSWAYSLALDAGLSKRLNVSLELYYNTLNNFRYLVGRSFLNPRVRYDDYLVDLNRISDVLSSNSKGLEFNLGWSNKEISYHFNYTWSKTIRFLDQVVEPLNVRAPFDRRHNFNGSLRIKLAENLAVNLFSSIASGSPASYVFNRQAQFFSNQYIDDILRYESAFGAQLTAVIRHDINLNYMVKTKNCTHRFGAGIYNFSNQKNELYRLVDDHPQLAGRKIIYPVLGLGRQFFLSYRIGF